MPKIVRSGIVLLIATLGIVILLALQSHRSMAQIPPTHTLILTNQTALERHFGITSTQTLLGQLQQLASHSMVSGTVVLLDQIPEVADAYTLWQRDLLNTTQANLVADAIHTVIREQAQAHDTLEYIVLVGDDRIIPHRRVPDLTPLYPEKTYGRVAKTTTVGAALADNMFLTDDFYGDIWIVPSTTVTLYMPSLAIGRLVESPLEMGAVITEFLELNGQIQVANSFVVGYEFIQDAAQATCDLLADRLFNAPDCMLVGDAWEGQLLDSHLQTSTAELLFFFPETDHERMAVPDDSVIPATQVAQWPTPIGGRLVYGMGSHSGLNVPTDSTGPTDWPQAWAAQGVAYLGNTGYGWGGVDDIGWSEKLALNFAEALMQPTVGVVGKALNSAKITYVATANTLDAYDRKVIMELTLYGLPMTQITKLQMDAFEPDNTCLAAKPIATDQSNQRRSLHAQDDVDWLSFTGVAGTTYRINAATVSSTTSLIIAQLYTNCSSPELVRAATEKALADKIQFEFVAPVDGTYYLKIIGDFGNGADDYLYYTVMVTASNQVFLPSVMR